MAVLVKLVHAAVASGQDRNTPHPSTGKTPAELMIRRQIKTSLPAIMRPTMDKVDMEAKAADKLASEKRKSRFDRAKHVKVQEMVAGDKVLIKQKKTRKKPPFDPKP